MTSMVMLEMDLWFKGIHGGSRIGKRNIDGRRLLEFCDEKELCVANTWFKKTEETIVTYSEHRTEISKDVKQ